MRTELITNSSVQQSHTPSLQKLKDASGAAVGSIFFGTLLQTIRKSMPARGYGFGGRGEEAFRGQLDTMWAEQVGSRVAGNNLADSLYQSYQRQAEAMDVLQNAGSEQDAGSGAK